MTEPCARVVCDSFFKRGTRVVTIEAVMHRLVLAEFNTHRLFSRNSASSRAIPIEKQIKRVLEDPAIPLEWGRNQKGMQAAGSFTGVQALECEHIWLGARDLAVEAVRALQEIGEEGVHKQVANRLLEPFMWHTVVCTSTEWDNFYKQRCSPLAQPEIRAVAEAIRQAIDASTTKELGEGEWHTPYIQTDEVFIPAERVKISAARCARVSYLTQNGVRDPLEDLAMYERLITADPGHWSPLEHVATPNPRGRQQGNLHRWLQLRHLVCGPYWHDLFSRRTVDVETKLV